VYPYITVVTEKNTTDRWKIFSQKSVPDCGKSPDYRAFSEDKVQTYSFSKEVNVSCWTTPAVIPDSYQCGPSCDPGMNGVWFKTVDDCFIADYNVQLPANFSVTEQLKFCPHTLRQDSRFREQYGTSTYCYSCSALTCPSKLFDSKNQTVDLSCWNVGETVRGDEYVHLIIFFVYLLMLCSVWWKLLKENCWIPNQVFDPLRFQGKLAKSVNF
jgi:hypothetical protein